MAANSQQETPAKNSSTTNTCSPRCILLFSGKRKSGKDYITDKLYEKLGDESVIIKLSGPIKSRFAQKHNLNLAELLSDGQYKEVYRLRMVKWSEDIRKEDYGYFCRAAIDMFNATTKSIWIVSDVRRKTDLSWFTENYGSCCKTIRIICSDEIRSQRGWKYTPGIDNAETECDLDNVEKWDLAIINETETIDNILSTILKII